MPSFHASDRSALTKGYELVEKIAVGGTSDVYLAHPPNSDELVVLKISELSSQSEQEILSTLHHPNIVRLLDSFETEEHRCLILERAIGSTLRDLMKPNKPWPVQRAYPVLRAISSALAYLHRNNVLHLDLKPENVLLEERKSTLKLADFGLALSREEAAMPRELKDAMGSLDYAAPEQRFGLPMDERTDVYALAALTYELLTGRIAGRVYTPLSDRSVNLPYAVDALLRAGLARNVEDRPTGILVFQHELNLALQRVLSSMELPDFVI